MREISLNLSEDSHHPLCAFAGFEGEHNATRLSLTLPPRLIKEDGIYYMIFESEKSGVMVFSAPLTLVGACVSVMLPRQVMQAPKISVHVAVYRQQKEELIQIAKSTRVLLEIKYPEHETVTELTEEGGQIPGLVIEEALLSQSKNPVSSRALYGELSALARLQIEKASVDETGDLILKRENGAKLNAGSVIGPKGEKGDQGPRGERGEKGEKGKADYGLVANALKGKASGAAIDLTDVSPLPHSIGVQLKSDTLTDFSAVTVTLSGKNKLNLDGYYAASSFGTKISTTEAVNGVTVTQTEYPNSGNNNSYENGYFFVLLKEHLKAGREYTLSFDIEFLSNPLATSVMPCLQQGSGSTIWFENNTAFEVGKKYKMSAAFKYHVLAADPTKKYFEFRNSGMSLVISNIQIELGKAATEYEPFKESSSYTPHADGTVDGVTSIYPTTVLVTDTEGVTIEAEYNRDLNQVIESILNTIGGN